MNDKLKLIVVSGPTAIGKTDLSIQLAKALDCDIISADSRQIYREMDIGTGKDYDDYLVEKKRVPVHLVDILDAGFEFVQALVADLETAARELVMPEKHVLEGDHGQPQ